MSLTRPNVASGSGTKIRARRLPVAVDAQDDLVPARRQHHRHGEVDEPAAVGHRVERLPADDHRHRHLGRRRGHEHAPATHHLVLVVPRLVAGVASEHDAGQHPDELRGAVSDLRDDPLLPATTPKYRLQPRG